MNKIRLIPVIFIKNGFIVRSEKFIQHKKIGNVVNQIRRYNQWDVDELIFIDISREKFHDSMRTDHKIERVNSIDQILNSVSNECFMPLAFGGGIRDLETIKRYIKNGADKIIVNTLFFENPNIIEKAIEIFGSQAIVLSLDFKVTMNKLSFYSKNGEKKEKESFEDIIKRITNLGVGELLLNSIDRDGTGEGYDIEVIKRFVDSLPIPVIACGGAISYFDFEQVALIKNISGIAAGNLFHFTENAYPNAKKKLKEKKLNFR